MAELEVDQTNLPAVQEVSQYFALLEDGALAHNLQEQEIEQYYSGNIQRSQLVQKDIRVAKRLQDEEQQRAHMLHRQTTRRLEEQDSEYARRIQEEIQQAAEELQRREDEDKEIAKQIQEEEALLVRQRNSYRRTDSGESGSIPSPPYRPSQLLITEDEGWQDQAWSSRVHSSSSSTSDYDADHWEHRKPGYVDYGDGLETRTHPRLVSEPPLRNRSRQIRRSAASQSGTTGHVLSGWGDVVRLIKSDMQEQGYQSCSSDDELFEPVYELERILRKRHNSVKECHRQAQQGRHAGRTESFRGLAKNSRNDRLYSNSESKTGGRQRRVHFQSDRKLFNCYSDSQRQLEGIAGGRREMGSYTVSSYPIISSDLYHGAASGRICQSQTQMRQQYQENADVGRRALVHNVNGNCSHDYTVYPISVRNSPFHEPIVSEIREEETSPDRFRERNVYNGSSCRVQGNSKRITHTLRNQLRQEGRKSRHYYEGHSRTCEHGHVNRESHSSTEHEEVERERDRWVPRTPQCSLSVSFRECSPRAGPRRNRTSLDLSELQQVLQDEELACRLQAEEEKLLRGGPTILPHLQSAYPEGDFRVAQVAQDEEIARFMQKQEIKSQLHSRELEDCGSGQGCREMSPVYDNRYTHDREMRRERMDSARPGFTADECSEEFQSPIPIPLAAQQQHHRNIAEQLDPTFHREENIQAVWDISGTSQASLNEEPPFVAPTKRQSDKSGRMKSKEKKDNVKEKQKESCKQQ